LGVRGEVELQREILDGFGLRLYWQLYTAFCISVGRPTVRLRLMGELAVYLIAAG
jgi:hypothetical protein